jgi:DNA-binding NtrC family response regulator
MDGAVEKLLVIDDDDDLLQMTAKRLRRKNFETDLGHTIAEAMTHFQPEPNKYTGIICDLFLEGENGLDFFEAVQKTEFAGEFILATGDDSGDPRIAKYRALPRFSCLQKPFELQVLVDILHRSKGA